MYFVCTLIFSFNPTDKEIVCTNLLSKMGQYLVHYKVLKRCRQLSYDVQSRYKVGVQCGNFGSEEALHTAHSYLHVFQLYFLQVV